MDAKQTAAALRTALRSAGFSTRAVSVRVDNYRIDVALRITVRCIDALASSAEIEQIAASFKRVARDASGEILNGGNLYVTVDFNPARRALIAHSAAVTAEMFAA